VFLLVMSSASWSLSSSSTSPSGCQNMSPITSSTIFELTSNLMESLVLGKNADIVHVLLLRNATLCCTVIALYSTQLARCSRW
jgi:hypothetical protein